ncbi:putative iron-regulated membrane protein [Paraburkholderia silvatlantica]|uniref:Putative iron-regulated membrane protein n=1 Tax=Paraburkholderia silvatlantica TaxID=321895 RepID=A0A2V4TAJ9_9BURK|nr:PepSY-associated TM helix domain-containing protein [Paraburkholderia silvatlantica]PYE19838.1 putative iron-regulated membrane protein [Paraburkholderia silvatlantica]
MKGSFRLSMQWLHTWAGVCAGWIIFLIFFNGTAAYFKQEITTWMKPEIAAAIDPVKSVEGAVAFLRTKAPDAGAWIIHVPNERNPVAEVSWRPRPKPGVAPVEEDDDDDDRIPPDRRASIDANGHPLAARDTEGGDYFFQFHFALHYLPVLGLILVVLASIALMVALTTGLITHRRIFAEFFTFRPRSGARSWRDAHTTFAVLVLPFHLMITYTGVGILVFFLMPWALFAHYPNPQGFYAELVSHPRAEAPSGHSAPLVPLTLVLRQAEMIWNGGHAETIRISNPGDDTATIQVDRQTHDLVPGAGNSLTFNAISGALVQTSPAPNAAATAATAVFGLHQARFARPELRWLLFLCGLAGTAMVATGLLLWTAKRKRNLLNPEYGSRGFKLVETLNVAVIAGYPASTAAYFWANRLLPLSIPSRANAEVLCAFACWGAVLAWSVRRPKRRAWIEVLGATAFLYLALPFVNAGTASRGTLANLLQGDVLYLAFDGVTLALGVFFAACALWLRCCRAENDLPPAWREQRDSIGLSMSRGSK